MSTHAKISKAQMELRGKRTKKSISSYCISGRHFLDCPKLNCTCICHRLDGVDKS